MSMRLSRVVFFIIAVGTASGAAAWRTPWMADWVRENVPQAAQWAVAAAALLAVVSMLVRFQGLSIRKWWRIRRRMGKDRYAPTRVALYGVDGKGMVFDGARGSQFIEVAAPPWTIARIASTGTPKVPMIPTEEIRENCLTQYDVPVAEIDFTTVGEWFPMNDRPSAALASTLGSVQMPLWGKTWIKVSVDEDEADTAIRRRRGKAAAEDREAIPDGLAKTVDIAARRIVNELTRRGFGARIAPTSTVRALHDWQMRRLAAAIAYPSWKFGGRGDTVTVTTFALPPNHWSPESVGEIGTVAARTQLLSVRMTRVDRDRKIDRIEFLAGFAVADRAGLSGTSASGLRRLSGQHRSALSRWLPEAADVPVEAVGATAGPNDDPEIAIPAGGVGVYLGPNKNRDRVFLSVAASPVPLYIGGPETLALQFVLRLSTQPYRIGIGVDTPGWRRLVAERQSDLVRFDDGSDFDVLVLSQQQYEDRRPAGKIVLVVADLTQMERPEAFLTAQGTTGVVGSRDDEEKFRWTVQTSEEQWVGIQPKEPAPVG